MKQSILDGNLQILLRSQDKKQRALSCFFDTKTCHEMYPDTVECVKTGTWVKEDSGNQRMPDNRYKVWAVYVRDLPSDEDGETIPEVSDDSEGNP